MIRVIVPVLDEEASIGSVPRDIPKTVSQVIVVDNGCRDRASEIARVPGRLVDASPRRLGGQARGRSLR